MKALKNILIKFRWAFVLILCFLIVQKRGFSITNDHQQNAISLEQLAGRFEMPSPDHLQLIENALLNNSQLDSIYTDEKFGYYLEKRKWFFAYQNNKLLTREKHEFGLSFEVPFDHKQRWTYNEEKQLILYEELDRMNELIDTILVFQQNKFYYQNSLLVKEVHEWNGVRSLSIRISQTDTTYSYTLSSSEYNTFYKYDGENKLVQTYDGVTYLSNGDSIYNAENRYYNSEGLLEYIEGKSGDFINNVTKYEFINPGDETGFEIIESHINYNPGKTKLDHDKITTWDEQTTYKLIKDSKGRDSILSNTMIDFRFPLVFNKKLMINYFYNDGDQLTKALYYVWDGTFEDGSWQEQGRVTYEYDVLGRLAFYKKIYYDLQYNTWEVLEANTYFYSPLKSTKTDQLKPSAEIYIYPNPASDHITIQIENSTQAQYQIYDLYGHQIQQGNLVNKVIDVSGLERGTYILKIINANSINVQRFMKK